MTGVVAVLLAFTLVIAVLDWVAVQLHMRPLEFVAKPLTMVALIGAVVAMQPDSASARVAFVVALAFSLVGDVFLMTKRRELFVFGLASFLVAHLAYIAGLWLLGITLSWFLVGLLVVAGAVVVLGLRIVNGVRRGEHAELTVPVIAYMSAISVMVASAFGTARPLPIVGACLFYASDALIAWNRFIEAKPWGEIAIIVTYHLGQIALALALVW